MDVLGDDGGLGGNPQVGRGASDLSGVLGLLIDESDKGCPAGDRFKPQVATSCEQIQYLKAVEVATRGDDRKDTLLGAVGCGAYESGIRDGNGTTFKGSCDDAHGNRGEFGVFKAFGCLRRLGFCIRFSIVPHSEE